MTKYNGKPPVQGDAHGAVVPLHPAYAGGGEAATSSIDVRGSMHVHHEMPPLRRLLTLLAPDAADLWVAVIHGAGVGLLTLAIPITVQSLVGTVAFGTLLQPLVVLSILLLAGLVFSAVLRGLQAYVVELVQRRVFARVAMELAWRLPRVKLEALDRDHGPELVNRFFDVLTVQKSAALLLLDGLAVVLGTLAGLLLLALYHPLLLGFGVVLAALMGLVLFVLGRGAVRTSIGESKAKYEVAAWLEELARHETTFRLQGGARLAHERAVVQVEHYLKARRQHYRLVFRQFAGTLGLQALASAALLGLGGYLVIQKQLTLGQLVAAELVVAAVVASFTKMGKLLESYYDLLAAVDKLGYLQDLALVEQGGVELPKHERGLGLSLHEATHTFAGMDASVGPLWLRVAPGERVVITGGAGAGKSILADLLAGLRLPTSGYYELDSFDVRDIASDTLRDQIALVRGIEVFDGSVLDNVSLRRPGVGTAEVRAVLCAVGLWEDVARLPAGLGTHLATGGAPLTASQAWRLSLARAMVGRPRLLVVDEMPALDEKTHRQVLDAMHDPAASWTLVLLLCEPVGSDPRQRVLHLVDGRLGRSDVQLAV